MASSTPQVGPDRLDSAQVPSKAVAWYKPDAEKIPLEFEELLREYSHIPSDMLVAHVNKVRDRAWEATPYPCIGSWRFLELNMSLSPVYHTIVPSLQNGQKLLDLGCGLGQDLRKLLRDGAPVGNVYGVDLSQGLIDVGFDLFLDGETVLGRQILAADVFAASKSEESVDRLMQLEGAMDIVFAGSFFHLFDWEQQLVIAGRIIKLLRACPGVKVFGHHLGHLRAGAYPYGLSSERKVFKHDPASFEQLWRQAGRETRSEWQVDATLHVIESAAGFKVDGKWGDQEGRLMRFCVARA